MWSVWLGLCIPEKTCVFQHTHSSTISGRVPVFGEGSSLSLVTSVYFITLREGYFSDIITPEMVICLSVFKEIR